MVLHWPDLGTTLRQIQRATSRVSPDTGISVGVSMATVAEHVIIQQDRTDFAKTGIG
jgi:hypothetical protein